MPGSAGLSVVRLAWLENERVATLAGAEPHRQQQILVSIFLTGVCIMEISSILLRFFGLVLFGAAVMKGYLMLLIFVFAAFCGAFVLNAACDAVACHNQHIIEVRK
jgi:hypothetical protein